MNNSTTIPMKCSFGIWCVSVGCVDCTCLFSTCLKLTREYHKFYAFYSLRHNVFWKTSGLMQPSWQTTKHFILNANDKRVIFSLWTEYCQEPYIHEICGGNAFLDCNQPQDEDTQPIFREKVEIAVEIPKKKSVRVDNIPAEFVQAGG